MDDFKILTKKASDSALSKTFFLCRKTPNLKTFSWPGLDQNICFFCIFSQTSPWYFFLFCWLITCFIPALRSSSNLESYQKYIIFLDWPWKKNRIQLIFLATALLDFNSFQFWRKQNAFTRLSLDEENKNI